MVSRSRSASSLWAYAPRSTWYLRMGAGFAAALAVMPFLPYMIADFPRFDVVESQLSPPTASSFRKMLLNMQHDQVLARDPSARPWRPGAARRAPCCGLGGAAFRAPSAGASGNGALHARHTRHLGFECGVAHAGQRRSTAVEVGDEVGDAGALEVYRSMRCLS